MKLIYCPICGDVFSLNTQLKECSCSSSKGYYETNIKAIYKGAAIPLGFSNTSLLNAIKEQPETDNGKGKEFIAFVLPKDCMTFKKGN